MSIFKKVRATMCTGKENIQCPHFVNKTHLPPFKAFCDDCGSPTEKVYETNRVAVAIASGMTLIVFVALFLYIVLPIIQTGRQAVDVAQDALEVGGKVIDAVDKAVTAADSTGRDSLAAASDTAGTAVQPDTTKQAFTQTPVASSDSAQVKATPKKAESSPANPKITVARPRLSATGTEAIQTLKAEKNVKEFLTTLDQYVRLGVLQKGTSRSDFGGGTGCFVAIADEQKNEIMDFLYYDGQAFKSEETGVTYTDLSPAYSQKRAIWVKPVK